MLQTENRPVELQALKGKILAAYEYLSKADDKENAVKVKELAAKILQEEFSIAFCGHFSAGKSTIINRLAGENLLPSSPIPTSANLVKVKSGTEYAKVFFKNEKPRLYLAPYDYELVKKYCKDGDQIKEIEISHANSTLPKHTVIIDTPGIDSTDDAHRIATESAIHLADLIFYVMDYNHVQSEINFMFSRELTAAGKEVYLVINQIDKHSEDELSFGDFNSSVVESFASWGVKPADIFYTSLKRDEHEHNQFAELQSFLHERLKEKDELLLRSVFHSLQKILWDHLALQRKKSEPEIQRLNELLQELTPQDREELTNNYSRLLEEQNQLEDGVAKAEGEFDAAVIPYLADLRRKVGRKFHLLRDHLLPASGKAQAVAQRRFHRRAIGTRRLVEMPDRVEHPGVDIAQEGFVLVPVAHAFFSAAFFLRIASWKRSAQPGFTDCSARTRRSSPSITSAVTVLPAPTIASRPIFTGATSALFDPMKAWSPISVLYLK